MQWKEAINMSHKVTDITVEELNQRLANGENIVVIDVRKPSDYARGHIEGAINFPYPWKRNPNLPPGTDVVVVCYVGMANRYYSRKLAKSSSGVFRLKGGMSKWTGLLSSELIVPAEWSLDRYVRFVSGITVLLSASLAAILSPWWLLLTAVTGVNLITGSLFHRCFIADQLRAMGYR